MKWHKISKDDIPRKEIGSDRTECVLIYGRINAHNPDFEIAYYSPRSEWKEQTGRWYSRYEPDYEGGIRSHEVEKWIYLENIPT